MGSYKRTGRHYKPYIYKTNNYTYHLCLRHRLITEPFSEAEFECDTLGRRIILPGEESDTA